MRNRLREPQDDEKTGLLVDHDGNFRNYGVAGDSNGVTHLASESNSRLEKILVNRIDEVLVAYTKTLILGYEFSIQSVHPKLKKNQFCHNEGIKVYHQILNYQLNRQLHKQD